MFVQALTKYANTYLSAELKDEAWEERPVPFLIELAPDGTFLNVVERMRSVPRGKKTIAMPEALSVPRSPVTRQSGLSPLLGVDDIRYVLGVGAWTAEGDRENHEKRHDAFIKLVREAAQETRDPGLEACQSFYAKPVEVDKARDKMKGAKTGTLVALSVGGPIVLRPSVQAYWREHYWRAFGDRVAEKGGFGECLVSGKFGPIAPTHEKIKGIVNLGGQASGVSLMSFNKDAFCSYGWSQNENSPVSPDCAMAYTLALNDLLRSGKGRRRDIAGVGFIFWLKRPEEFNPFDALEQPDEKQVEALLALDPAADPAPNEFYMAGVSGNGGRLRVRYWVTDSLPHIKHNLGKWFEGLRVTGFDGPADPVRFWQLLYAIHREGKPPDDRVIALLRRAIEGRSQPLGYRMLEAALSPLRRAGKPTPERLGLVRLCVNDLIHAHKKRGDKPMTESLDPEQRNSAYLCGRLLAEYEGLQYSSFSAAGESKVNLSVADRYYSLASTHPAIAFPRIEDLGRKHLRKLQRWKPGAAVAIDQRLQELHGLLEQAAGYRFPSMLNLDEQGRFALGYHHQRAHSMAQAKARREERAAKENHETQGQED
jgi:CRISPR-associated protein Csd1